MIKKFLRKAFDTPLGFMRSLKGSSKICLAEDVNMYRLGKECTECKKTIIHREAISICQCYSFAHKECLKKQLLRQKLSECTTIRCESCKELIRTNIYFHYQIQLIITIENIVILLLCLAICVFSMIYIVNFNNEQKYSYGRHKNG